MAESWSISFYLSSGNLPHICFLFSVGSSRRTERSPRCSRLWSPGLRRRSWSSWPALCQRGGCCRWESRRRGLLFFLPIFMRMSSWLILSACSQNFPRVRGTTPKQRNCGRIWRGSFIFFASVGGEPSKTWPKGKWQGSRWWNQLKNRWCPSWVRSILRWEYKFGVGACKYQGHAVVPHLLFTILLLINIKSPDLVDGYKK